MSTASTPPKINALITSATLSLIKVEPSFAITILISAGKDSSNLSIAFFTASAIATVFVPDCFWIAINTPAAPLIFAAILSSAQPSFTWAISANLKTFPSIFATTTLLISSTE